MKIKYTKNVSWLEEFVLCVDDIIPIENIKRIKGYKVALGLNETKDAAIHVANSKADKFYITIKLYDQELVENELKHIPMQTSRILDSLSHELAHLVHWEHTPEHFKLQAQIMHRFYKILKLKKIDDTWKPFTKYLS